jgi:hypothetical protein
MRHRQTCDRGNGSYKHPFTANCCDRSLCRSASQQEIPIVDRVISYKYTQRAISPALAGKHPSMVGSCASAPGGVADRHNNIYRTFVKRVITCILIGVVLYFLLPVITKFIPQYRLAVWSITAALVAFVVTAGMDKV